jgi:4-amino-4-deoxychorismate lyase
MSAVIFRGNDRVEILSSQDRGLMYGDGLFETLRASAADLPWWPLHWRRLQEGALRLGLQLPDEALIHDAAKKLLDGRPQVLKIVLTRGESGRGYQPVAGPGTCILSSHALPSAMPGRLSLHWCTTAVARQPALAGLKHLNRLENVLARRECTDAGHAEGLMSDCDGHVICATAANVFLYVNGCWLTPDLSQCGIAGIARAMLLTLLPDIRVSAVTRPQLENAEAVFLCNAVRGIMAVHQVGSVPVAGHAALDALKQRFLDAHPFFANE